MGVDADVISLAFIVHIKLAAELTVFMHPHLMCFMRSFVLRSPAALIIIQ